MEFVSSVSLPQICCRMCLLHDAMSQHLVSRLKYYERLNLFDLDHSDLRCACFRAADDARRRKARSLDRLDEPRCAGGRARDQETARGLRVGEQMTFPLRQSGLQCDRLAVARPVAMRGAGDEALLGQHGGVGEQWHL